TYLLILPLVLLAVLRPAWLVMLLVAIPPAVMNLASIRAPTVILLFALVVHLARKGGLSTGLVVGALPIVALLALGYLFRADVTSTAAVARENFLKQLTYYVMLLVLTFSLVRTGQLRIGQLVAPLLLGAGIT